MARNSEVGQQPVNLLDAVVAHPVLQIPEITSYKCEALIADDVLLCILILVEAVQMSLCPQPTEDLTAVSAAAESHIYVNTVGLDLKPVDALLQEYWYMVTFNYHCGSKLFTFSLFHLFTLHPT